MCLDRKEEAKEFLQFFKDSGVSVNQMASWAREDIAALEDELKGQRVHRSQAAGDGS